MKNFFVVMCIITLGCATNSHNQIVKNNASFSSGKYKNKEWNDKLKFKRLSWYHGAALYYDTLVTRMDKKSGFKNWLTSGEDVYFNRCADFLVAVSYSKNPKFISHAMFKKQMEESGYESVTLANFAGHLRNHVAWENHNLYLYKVDGYCRKKVKRKSGIKFNFPGFEQVKLSL